MRKDQLVAGCFYHILNRSIAGFKVLNDYNDFNRFLELVKYYRREAIPLRYSQFCLLSPKAQKKYLNQFSDQIVTIIAYCLMPTHFHLLLKQNTENGVSQFMSRIENGYTRYFNLRHKRKGPLWESRFKSILITTDEQLLHLTRYIHLNPSSTGLVTHPRDWKYSSYHEYLSRKDAKGKMCHFRDIIGLTPEEYRNFVEDRISYQRELSKIKTLILENDTQLPKITKHSESEHKKITPTR